MLLAASESAVTKKPRLRLTMRRSSSVSPLGFFQRAMSRDMLISCGIQWLAQVARYFSQAHLYLNGTSWLTSVLPLMMRLSATFTRCEVALPLAARPAACCGAAGVGRAASPNTPVAGRTSAPGCPPAAGADGWTDCVARLSSSQLIMIHSPERLLAGFALFEAGIARPHGANRPENFGFGQNRRCGHRRGGGM